MAHPYDHAKSSVKRWGGIPTDYIEIHEWLDATKSWIGHAKHRMFRHHSEGIFECEKIFGPLLTNADGKTVYTRYVAERHVQEDCNGYVPSAKEWVQNINSSTPPEWMVRTLKINTD